LHTLILARSAARYSIMDASFAKRTMPSSTLDKLTFYGMEQICLTALYDKAAAALDSRISMNGSCALIVVPSFPDTI
jgi:hypothetical protein